MCRAMNVLLPATGRTKWRSCSAQPECSTSTLCEPIQQLDEFTRDSIVKVVMSKHNQALYFSRATISYDRDGAKESDTTIA